MTTNFLVVGASGVAASAAASAALNASTSAWRTAASNQQFWRAVGNDHHLGPVAAVVVLAALIAVVAMFLKAVFTLWTTR